MAGRGSGHEGCALCHEELCGTVELCCHGDVEQDDYGHDGAGCRPEAVEGDDAWLARLGLLGEGLADALAETAVGNVCRGVVEEELPHEFVVVQRLLIVLMICCHIRFVLRRLLTCLCRARGAT